MCAFTWANSAAYGSGDGLRRHFDDVASGVEKILPAPLHGRRRFQGHVLDVADFLATWTVEFALHHIDLTAHLTHRPQPTDSALDVAATTFDGLLGIERPASWYVIQYVLKASGRLALSEQDEIELGTAATRYPALG